VKQPPTLTVPVAPKLATHARTRSFNQMPTETLAAEATNKLRRSATPVAVTRAAGPTPALADQPRRLTVAQAPRLHTAERPRSRPSSARSVQRPESATSQKSSNTSSGPKEPTEPRPFQLATENRGQLHQTKLQQQIEAERKQAEEQARVRAKPMPNLTRAFVPKRAEKVRTVQAVTHATRRFQIPISAHPLQSMILYRVASMLRSQRTLRTSNWPAHSDMKNTMRACRPCCNSKSKRRCRVFISLWTCRVVN
jgi:hypothetical protein